MTTTERTSRRPPVGFGRMIAQGGSAVPARPGQLRRRHQPAGHAARGGPAQPVRARTHHVDRHLRGRGPPEGEGRHHRRAARDAEPGVDPVPVPRRHRRPGHRQGALPGPGGRVRRRRGPLLRPRRARADRRRLRPAAAGRRRTARPRPGRPGHPRRHRGQDRQPHLRLGGRRPGRDRRRLRGGRGRGDPGHALPARPPRADGDLRLDRRHGQGDRQAHHLVHDPGAARPPHAVRAGGRAARAQDPGDHPRHRRRLRQQGRHLPRLRPLRRRLDRHRQAGEVGRGPLGEPRCRPPSPATTTCTARSRRRATARSSACASTCWPTTARSTTPRSRPKFPAGFFHIFTGCYDLRGGALQGHGRLHQQGARRRGLRLLVPRHRGGLPRRAHRRLPGRRARHGPGRAADEEPAAPRAVPVHVTDGLGVRLRRLPARAADGAGDGRLRRRCAGSRRRSASAAS